MTTPTEQPEAIRLADALAYCDNHVASRAAAELRRLHAENEALRKQNEAQRDEWLAWDAKRKDLERDAERYRHLRQADPDSEVAPMRHECNDWGKWYWLPVLGTELDNDLDAAIKALEQRVGES